MHFNRISIHLVTSFCLCLIMMAACTTGKLDRSKKPKAGSAPELSFSDYEKFTLNNGLTVFVVEDKNAPSVTYSLEIDRDPVQEGKKKGYVSLAGDMLGTQTSNRSKEELNQEVDFIGATLSPNATGVYASALKKRKEKLLELTADVVKNAEFSQEELKKKKLQKKSSLQASENDPSSIASRVYKKLIYGKNHPYGEITTQETVERVELADIEQYYKTYFRPNISYLAVVGNTSREEIQPLIEKHFGDWEKRQVPDHDYDQPSAPDEPQVAVVNRPDAEQSTVRLGHAVDLQLGDDHYTAARLANTILGGGAFRLFKNLREKYSFTYGAYSRLSPDQKIGRFIAAADVKSSATDSAIGQILHEIERLRNEPVPEEELTRAQKYITGNFAISLEDPKTIANYAIRQEMNDLPKDFYETYLKRINRAQPSEVKDAANQYIRPGKSHILVVGKASAFKDKLDQFGNVTYYDKYGNKTDAPVTKTVPEGMDARDVIDKYIKAIGGKKNIGKINSYQTTYEGQMQGRTIQAVQKRKTPNLYKSVMKVGPMEMMQVFDGAKGYAKSMQGQKEIKGAELARLQITSRLFYLAHLDETDVQATLEGIETIDGKPAFKITFTTPDKGAKWTEYFSTETGLRIAEKQTQKTPQGERTQTTLYGDYKDHNGVKFPSELTVNMGQRKIRLQATSIQVNPSLADDEFAIE